MMEILFCFNDKKNKFLVIFRSSYNLTETHFLTTSFKVIYIFYNSICFCLETETNA